MNERFAEVNGVEICFETLGDPGGRPLLLSMGLGGPMIWWDDGFCAALVERGFHVIRYDNRDCGRSTILHDAPAPKVLRSFLGLSRSVAYRVDDLADDALGLLDHLGIEAAHVMGGSLGGMVAQSLAIRFPDRVLSLVSMSSTTGGRTVGLPSPRILPLVMTPPPKEREAYIEQGVRAFRAVGSPGAPFDEERVRALAAATFDRGGVDATASARQLVAIAASPDRTPRLRELNLPALVIHGSDDPVVNVSGGRATARAIPGAELLVIQGMGHDLPPQAWPAIVDAVDRVAARGERLRLGDDQPVAQVDLV